MIISLVKSVMRECGLTQKGLAEVLGVTLDRVKSLSSGKAQKLTREESEALVKKLNIRAEWLVTGEGPMFQAPADRELQRRLDVVAHVSRQAAAMYLPPDQADLLQRITMAAETGDSATLAMLLRPLAATSDEAALLDNYRHSTPEARAALRATSAALAKFETQIGNENGGVKS